MSEIKPERPNYYKHHIDPNQLTPEVRELFETYSKIPADRVEAHLHTVRDKAFDARPYACIGQWIFLKSCFPNIPGYADVLAKAKEPNARICEIGCGLGQDMRRLLADGARPENFFVSDTCGEFWPLSMELWQDEDRLQKATFVPADLFSLLPESEVKHKGDIMGKTMTAGAARDEVKDLAEFRSWAGTMDVVYSGQLLHCFDDEVVKQAIECLALLVKPEGFVLSWHVGGNGYEFKLDTPGGEHKLMLLNEEICRERWAATGEKLGMRFEVQHYAMTLKDYGLEDSASMSWLPPDGYGIVHIAKRVA